MKKHILFFDFLENHYVPNNEISKQHLNVIKKSNFVKTDKTLIDNLIEQNNFTNQSLHIISQQLDRIEEKIVEKSVPAKTEKPLIDLPSQREKVMFKTSQSKTLEIVEKMLSDLKTKTESTSTSTSTKEIVPEKNTESDIVSSIPSVPADEIYEWNIDGLSELEIVTKMIHMSMVSIAYQNDHNLDQPDIINLLVTGFSGALRGWWDSYITKESRESIKHAVKKNDECLPIFDGSIVCNGVNTLIYTILKHFVGTPSNILSNDYLNDLSCPTMSEYRWYQDVFISRVMLKRLS